MRPSDLTTFSMHNSANPWIDALQAYQPGKSASPEAAAAVKLSSNENPQGGTARIAQLLAAGRNCEIGRYPDDSGSALRAILAAQLGVSPDNVLLGSGSSDLLSIVARAFLAPGREALVSSYTFALYRLIAAAAGASVRVVASDGYGHDLDALVAASASANILFIDNPCNPTGVCLSFERLRGVIEALPPGLPVVIDEAYFEYATEAGYSSCIELVERHPNVLVVRTFSKAYGLAGIRLGYCIGHAGMIALLNKVRAPFNISSLAGELGQAALRDAEFVQRSSAANAGERTRVSAALGALDMTPAPSAANFLFFDTGRDAAQLALALERRGVLVRALPEYPRHLRVTLGLPAENERFLAAMRDALAA